MKADRGRYSKVSRRMWNDADFRDLSGPPPNAQTLWQRLLTGPELTNVPGLFGAWDAGLACALQWPVEGFREAFREVSAKGMAKADWKAGLVWVPKAIVHNEPENPNVVLSWRAAWEELPECDLKDEAYEALHEHLKGLGEQWVSAFEKACQKPSTEGYQEPYPEGSAKGLANQEQEQEQEQEDHKHVESGPPELPAGSPPPLQLSAPGPTVKSTNPEREHRASARFVFESWKLDTGHHNAKLDAKREARIVARLRDGFTPDQLVLAVTHRRNDPWLMGETSGGRVFDGIETLLRDRAQVERLIDLSKPIRASPKANQQPKQPNGGHWRPRME